MSTSVNIVETKHGKVRGKQVTTQNGTPYYAYYGVPYAKPPLGDLRFKPPVAPDSWVGIHDGTNTSDKVGVQIPLTGNDVIGEEDCLVLNVYSPITATDKPLPVMVYIHGGGFVMGSNDTAMGGPDFLVDDQVLVVSINYRLGILGFLNLDLPEAQGNMGLKDQVFALKWVQDNISSFGGNPASVTIFGISAGGASVELHCLSPMSEGLFHRAVIQSGSSLNPWAHNYNIKDYAFTLAKNLGREFDDPKELLQFLKELPAKDLVGQVSTVLAAQGNVKGGLHFGFVPSVEKRFPSRKAFLTESTLEILKRGDYLKVPIITGFCRHEGLIIGIMNPAASKTLNEDKDFFSRLPFTITDAEKNNFEDRFKRAYLNNSENQGEAVSPATDYFTDVDFLGGIYVAATLISQKNRHVYLYEFAHEGELSVVRKMMSVNGKGVSHGDDMGYVFKVDMLTTAAEIDVLVRSRVVKLWTNFAKFGNPTPKPTELLPVSWKPITSESFQFLVIDDNLTMSRDLYPERMALHRDLYNTV